MTGYVCVSQKLSHLCAGGICGGILVTVMIRSIGHVVEHVVSADSVTTLEGLHYLLLRIPVMNPTLEALRMVTAVKILQRAKQ